MTQTTMIVAIDRPLAQVFAFVADAETAPQWQDDLAAVRRTTPGPLRIGTAYRAQRLEARAQVATMLLTTAYDVQHTVAFETMRGDVRCRDSYAFRAVGASTRVTLRCERASDTRGVRPVVSRDAALAKLKLVLETRPSEQAGSAHR